MPTNEQFQKIKEKLDSVGPGFCLAKWNQVTIHLGTGLNHSCHHPSPHKIVEADVLRNPACLHNTLHKKHCWKEMLEGKRPKECEYCWRIEDTSSEFSDRVFKSIEPWALPTFDQIKNSYWRDDYCPRYVEISFSNRCNCKCLYCSPNFSSRWDAEAREFGGIALPGVPLLNEAVDEKSRIRCEKPGENVLVQAFWKWWPELFKSVHSLRLTGGEPLLVRESYMLMDYMVEHIDEAKNLKFFSVNTNLNMSDDMFDRLVVLYKQLSEKIPEVILFTSIESGEKETEYIRFGLNYTKFWNRIEQLLAAVPKLTVSIMATYNVLSMTTFLDTLEKAFELKKKYNNWRRIYSTSIMVDTSYLRYPSFLDIHTAPRKYRSFLEKCIDFVESKASNSKTKTVVCSNMEKTSFWEETWPVEGFCEMEVDKIRRLLDYFDSVPENFDTQAEKQRLKVFLEELDSRRGTNFRNIWKDESSLGL